MMQKQSNDTNASRIADVAFAASRQVWLAGLGAAAVTRQWARNEAGNTLRALIKEGSAVETQAIRAFGNGFETSLSTASSIWSRTRKQLQATVTTLADTASAALPQLKAIAATRKSPVAKPRKAAGKTASTKTASTRSKATPARSIKRTTRKSK
jgi:hypothetical protein